MPRHTGLPDTAAPKISTDVSQPGRTISVEPMHIRRMPRPTSHRIVRLPRWIAICSASVIALQASVAQPATERSIPEEPRVFVQRFLATYVRWLNRDIGRLERMRGLRSGSPFVDLRLLEELEADFAAQASDRSGSIVGIDWEPFVGGQDPCERYEVGSIRVKESARLVDVHPACNARRSDEASAR